VVGVVVRSLNSGPPGTVSAERSRQSSTLRSERPRG
jgi:hypothetical protein